MAPKALLVCLLIVAVAFVEAGKHPKANKIKKGEFVFKLFLKMAERVVPFKEINPRKWK